MVRRLTDQLNVARYSFLQHNHCSTGTKPAERKFVGTPKAIG